MKHWLWIGAIAGAAAMFGGTTGQVREAQAQLHTPCNQKTCAGSGLFVSCTGQPDPTKNCMTIGYYQYVNGHFVLVSKTCKSKTCL